ncbi:hypothetical protein Pcinc_021851 [Petrolisthes cinctipes]|uniref:protein-glutamine gamma-glutamyltransferase n=1 Tax=Petrolisthes cinctipes TaxID=88211 RepID=A0AAE1FGS6_PETCI|nr:hypothetical protein Pcinc_021851 [Petrolisthes cinctipes]
MWSYSDFLALDKFDLRGKENAKGHHTLPFLQQEKELARLVVRRGQEFTIILHTSRDFDQTKDSISLIFTVADCKSPTFGNGTQVGVGVGVAAVEGGWSATVTKTQEKTVTITVKSSSNAIVGEWKLEADVKTEGRTYNYTCDESVYILFNPWCQEDTVYLAGDAECQEYVVEDSGLIWRGTSTRLRPCPWNFGQYEEHVLECVLHLLSSVCQLQPPSRNDPIKVSRALSAGINSPDDAGVLVGNWSTDYSGGVSPTKWGGSPRIFQQYYTSKRPVKYGQCWVFSGIMTTACRALGLPARSITNFSSAHDTHSSLTIDYFFDDDLEVIERLNSDSVWNFHVWNEVWMKRKDLGEKYNGWQAVDATPQEESDGQYRCGPSSLVAIKAGEVQRPYDVPFVFAEVNADKLYWKYCGPCQPMKLLGHTTDGIGQFVSTKAVGKNAREDVTHLYKYTEASSEERNVMKNALRLCENNFARYYLNQHFEDVEFDFKLNDDIIIGQPFSSSVVAHNKSEKEYDVEVVLRADTMFYTGRTKTMVKRHRQHLNLKPFSKETVMLEVSFEEYYSKLENQCAFNLSCLCKVEQTQFEYFAKDDFRCRKPDIKVEYEGEMKLREKTKCRASFTNPLPFPLTRACFIIQGAGLCRLQFIRIKESVPAGGEACCEFTVRPLISGERTLTVMFDSRQLEDVDGMLTVSVTDPEDPAVEASEDGGDKPNSTQPPPETTPCETVEVTTEES